jgi:hypothetical protein
MPLDGVLDVLRLRVAVWHVFSGWENLTGTAVQEGASLMMVTPAQKTFYRHTVLL